ncbi:MAG: hypothetical protein KQH83_05065 [Actinobacteria bacterium]|nr:hypothetical protein [Actinomycetota bacterium]
MRRWTALILATALATAAAGCGDDQQVLGDGTTTAAPTTGAPTTAGPTTTGAPATTAAPTTEATTTAPSTTVTTAPPTTTTTVAPTLPPGPYYGPPPPYFPAPLPGSDQAHGSGCVVPGGSTTLPDGIWFGFAEGTTPGMLTFDLACFWTGAVAVDKATEDGEEAFDFYIRNNNPTTRQVPVSASARVWYVDMTSPDVSVPDEIPLSAWPHPDSFMTCPDQWCSVWIYVNDGEVTALVEQYLP